MTCRRSSGRSTSTSPATRPRTKPSIAAARSRADGSGSWVAGKSSSDNIDGSPRRMTGIHIDITERKQAEETRARLTAILDATPDLVAIATADFTTLYMNPAGRRMLGLDEHADLSGRWIGDTYSGACSRRRCSTKPFRRPRAKGCGEAKARSSAPTAASIPRRRSSSRTGIDREASSTSRPSFATTPSVCAPKPPFAKARSDIACCSRRTRSRSSSSTPRR